MEKELNVKDYGLLEGITPYKTYIKTILAKVRVYILSPFTGKVEEISLYGNPRSRNNEDCIVDVYSPKEDMFFKKQNSYHFNKGSLIEYVRPPKVELPEDTVNIITDEEIEKILKDRFYTLKARVDKMTEIAPVYRVITKAKEMEKSEKIIKFLEGKLSEIQMAEYQEEDLE